ncbi:ATP-binding protein [Paenibacillus sp. CGMCC 1.16610]|uniref:AAA family ATPase n=1 Tax=Paenibacillus anseongense TaxID=2682845 RepID=A0ABW9UL40_9BACL|nr:MULTISPECIES: ATP-binding protein [Paenibacillus]MBA2941058.1 ATP-binding protein [Paenibacillus sp. CGMCC 1.16610]MVQ39878.1 AAA family ATPase [Paenibacillus anseongense]
MEETIEELPIQITSINRPLIVQGSHPVYTGRYLLSTNEISKLYEKLKKCIQNRFPGAIIHGRPRLGKSRAIKYLMNILPDDFGNLPIYVLLCREHTKPNEDVFFTEILRDIGHSLSTTGKAVAKRERLLKFLVQQAKSVGLNRIIFFIDDAQRLHVIQYGWLMDICNELDSVGISLTVFLVGQEELINQRNVFFEEGKQQIIGRFMVHQHQFSGVKTIDDLKECLVSYDEESFFPEDSGCSFTRYFFPNVQNFSLAAFAKELFNIFSEMRLEAGIRTEFEIPMQYVTLTIEYALRTFGVEGENLDVITQTKWREAIESSGYLEAEASHL